MVYEYTLSPFSHIPNCAINEPGVGRATCEDTRSKIIALRIYFALVILNFIFGITTTAYFIYRLYMYKNLPPIDISSVTSEKMSKQWRIYSLKKRNMFGSILGALGHLIFVTTVLIYQVFVTPFSCDIFLWGPLVGFLIWIYALIWRTRRLHIILKINELQKKYHLRTTRLYDRKGEKLVASTINKKDKDYKWFMQHKGILNKGSKHHIFMFCSVIVVVAVIIVLAEYLGIWVDGQSRCEIYVGNYIILGLVLIFFCAVVPFIFWHLRDDEDAHGIRKEIWVTVAVGVPCSILAIIWQTLFPYPTSAKPAGLRGLFGPCNWLIILTTTNHVMSIVLPVFKTLSLERPKKRKSSCHNINGTCKQSWFAKHNLFRPLLSRDDNDKVSTLDLGHSTACSGYRWELTVDSLLHALNDPNQIAILKNWAVKDFSIENVLFYDRYIHLTNQLKQSLANGILLRDQNKNPENFDEYCDLSRVYSQTSFISQSPTSFSSDKEILNIPFEPNEIPQVIDFYNMFIADQSPLQVNISHKARVDIDAILGPISRKMNLSSENTSYSGILDFLQSPDISSFSPQSAFDMTTYTIHDSFSKPSSTHSTLINEKDFLRNSRDTTHHISLSGSSVHDVTLTLQIFEQARKEVFWNIFSGLFPKVVEAYNKHSYD